MKFMHLSDLHIGKRVNEFSMLEDQKYILARILKIAADLRPDTVLITGDIYDKSIPPAEAVEMFDEFLTRLAQMKLPCFVISGNHDSPERIAFGARIMTAQKIHMSKVFDGTLEPKVVEDEIGTVNIYMLPFIKPAQVRRFYPEDPVETYQAGVEVVLANSGVNPAARNVLMAHQFVTSAGKEPLRSESESVSVGGLENVDASAFAAFDYVALGHLHAPQGIGRETIRYAGSPLKYSFSEVRHTKSVTIVELGEKNQVRIDTIPLEPLRDMREIKGPLRELISPSAYAGTNIEDYMHITLTDEEEIIDAIGKVHAVYPNVMRLEYDNQRTRSINTGLAAREIHLQSPVQLFREFYQIQNNAEIDDEKMGIVTELLEKLGGT